MGACGLPASAKRALSHLLWPGALLPPPPPDPKTTVTVWVTATVVTFGPEGVRSAEIVFDSATLEARVPVVTLHEGGQYAATRRCRTRAWARNCGCVRGSHADKSVNSHNTHPLEQGNHAASEQTASLVRKAGKARKAGAA